MQLDYAGYQTIALNQYKAMHRLVGNWNLQKKVADIKIWFSSILFSERHLFCQNISWRYLLLYGKCNPQNKWNIWNHFFFIRHLNIWYSWVWMMRLVKNFVRKKTFYIDKKRKENNPAFFNKKKINSKIFSEQNF